MKFHDNPEWYTHASICREEERAQANLELPLFDYTIKY